MPSGGLAQITVTDNVVAVKDRTCLVAGDLLGDALRDTSTDHIAHGSTSEIVKEFAFEPNRLTCCLPGITKIFDPPPCAMEHPGTKRQVRVPFSLQDQQGLKHFAIQIDRPAFLILRRAWIKTHSAGMEVHAAPCKPQDFLLTPPRIVRKGNHRSQLYGESSPERHKFIVLEKSSPYVALLEHGNIGLMADLWRALLEGEVEHALERSQLPVDLR